MQRCFEMQLYLFTLQMPNLAQEYLSSAHEWIENPRSVSERYCNRIISLKVHI
jgi:hypothetical protein